MAKSSMKNRDAHGDRKSGRRDYDERGQRAQEPNDRDQRDYEREKASRSGTRSNAGDGGTSKRKGNDS